MLKELSVKNYKSINQEILFSMEADTERVSEHPKHIININNNKLLKIASMYGPNGGGKTNVLEALSLVKTIILNNNFPVNYPFNNIACEFSNNKTISETMFFVTEKYEIGYKIDTTLNIVQQNTMDTNGNKISFNIRNFILKNEVVVFKEKGEDDFKVLFERDSKGNITSDMFDNLNINYSKIINENLSALVYFYTTFVNISNIKNVEYDVILNLYHEIVSIYDLEVTNVNMSVAINAITANKEKLISLLNDVDIKISDIILSKNDKISPIKFERELNINGKLEKKYISLQDESKGTKKIFWMFVNLLNEKAKNHIFFCDDMNAYLHPKLYKTIIELFSSEYNKNNQLIFNSHDIINMTNEIFRRDEIWFVYRDDNYSTKIVPLSNIVNYKGEQVRKDAKYYKQYLEGRYGADPFIKKGLEWND